MLLWHPFRIWSPLAHLELGIPGFTSLFQILSRTFIIENLDTYSLSTIILCYGYLLCIVNAYMVFKDYKMKVKSTSSMYLWHPLDYLSDPWQTNQYELSQNRIPSVSYPTRYLFPYINSLNKSAKLFA